MRGTAGADAEEAKGVFVCRWLPMLLMVTAIRRILLLMFLHSLRITLALRRVPPVVPLGRRFLWPGRLRTVLRLP